MKKIAILAVSIVTIGLLSLGKCLAQTTFGASAGWTYSSFFSAPIYYGSTVYPSTGNWGYGNYPYCGNQGGGYNDYNYNTPYSYNDWSYYGYNSDIFSYNYNPYPHSYYSQGGYYHNQGYYGNRGYGYNRNAFGGANRGMAPARTTQKMTPNKTFQGSPRATKAPSNTQNHPKFRTYVNKPAKNPKAITLPSSQKRQGSVNQKRGR